MQAATICQTDFRPTAQTFTFYPEPLPVDLGVTRAIARLKATPAYDDLNGLKAEKLDSETVRISDSYDYLDVPRADAMRIIKSCAMIDWESLYSYNPKSDQDTQPEQIFTQLWAALELASWKAETEEKICGDFDEDVYDRIILERLCSGNLQILEVA
jgi:hypothetical protein